MSTDALFPQRVQTGFEQCAQHLSNPKTKVPILARLVKEMILTPDDWKQANELAIKQYLAQEAEKKRIAEEGRERQKLYDMPDSRFHILYNNRQNDPISLHNWINRTPTADLEAYLKELKEKPYHYRSLFKEGDIFNATQTLQTLINEKKANEKPKAEAKPEKPATQPTTPEYAR
jgi:hypothetical protein